MDGYKFEVQNYGFTPISEIENSRGRTIRIAGFVTDAAHMVTKKGSKFGKLMLNDYTGHQEIVFWENNYIQYNNFIDNGLKLMIQGVYQEHKYRPGVMEFQIQSIMLLDQVRKTLTKRMHLYIPLEQVTPDTVAFLTDNIKKHPGNTEVVMQIADEQENMLVKLKTNGLKLEINDDLINYLADKEAIRYSLETT
jgi:DNA polymerase III subunit alpha